MNPLRLALLLIAVLPAARADDAARTVLSQETGPGEWKPLVDALAGKGPIVASFTERRFFPFRREGTVLKGILRISPQRGLSLQYVSPDPSILIADASGLLMKDESGRASEMPVGSRQSGAVSALLPIMRFDLPALYPRFVIRARSRSTARKRPCATWNSDDRRRSASRSTSGTPARAGRSRGRTSKRTSAEAKE
jgi:hypothetical protein